MARVRYETKMKTRRGVLRMGLLTCLCTDIDRLWPHASVDLDIFVREPGAQFCYLWYTAVNEFLSTPTCKYAIKSNLRYE